MGSEGILAMSTGEGGTTGDVFHAFVQQQLLPCLEKGDIVVMDNLKAHKDKRIKALIESVGASICYQPPYSPEFNAKKWLMCPIINVSYHRFVQAVGLEEIALVFGRRGRGEGAQLQAI